MDKILGGKNSTNNYNRKTAQRFGKRYNLKITDATFLHSALSTLICMIKKHKPVPKPGTGLYIVCLTIAKQIYYSNISLVI
jgi:hypothetical protein